MGNSYPGRITVVGATVCIGLLLVAAAVWSSYSQFAVARSIGMIGPLCPALPLATDLMVLVATIVGLSPHFSPGVREYAKWIAIGGGFFSFGIGALHYLLPQVIAPGTGWGWVKFLVGGIPSICMGLSIHLVAMIHARDRAHLPVAPPVVETVQESVKTPVPVVTATPAVPQDPDRPEWLQDGMKAKEAMFAYLVRRPETSGADLDRLVGMPYFGTKGGYGRKTRNEWVLRTGWRPPEAIGE